MYGNDDNSDTFNDVPGSYDPYFMASAKVSYKIDRTITASLSIKNLSDRKFYQGTSKADGRSVYLGIGLKY